jgi:2-hydroxy-3-keto-5-methylthiopentenyl-1-phosphate phosphatase
VESTEKGKVIVRKDFDKLARLVKDSNIPFYMLSAGLGDVIKICTDLMVERGETVDFISNLDIVSNFYEFNSDGLISGFDPQIITTMTKQENLY